MNVKLPNVSIIEDGNNFVSVMINQQDVTPKIYMDWQYDKKSSDYYSLKDIKSVENLKPFYTIDKGKKKLEYNFEEFFNLILEGARKAWGVGNKLGANW